jgi:D-Tyr-tRNAtyr deacylase
MNYIQIGEGLEVAKHLIGMTKTKALKEAKDMVKNFTATKIEDRESKKNTNINKNEKKIPAIMKLKNKTKRTDRSSKTTPAKKPKSTKKSTVTKRTRKESSTKRSDRSQSSIKRSDRSQKTTIRK